MNKEQLKQLLLAAAAVINTEEKSNEPAAKAPDSRCSSVSRASSSRKRKLSPEREQVAKRQRESVGANYRLEVSSSGNVSGSRASSVSKASTSKFHQRASSERGQGRENNSDPMRSLAMLLMKETVIPKKDINPVQGYVRKEQYECLREKYNRLQADYEALQERYRLTLNALGTIGDSGVESDTNEVNNGELSEAEENDPNEENGEIENDGEAENEDEGEDNDEEVRDEDEEVPDDEEVNDELEDNEQPDDDSNEEEGESQDAGVNPNEYVSSDQWKILLRSATVKHFVENALKILFDKDTLLTLDVKQKNGKSSSDEQSVQIKTEVLRELLDRYLKEKKFSNEISVKGRNEWKKHMSDYIRFLKQKAADGFDIKYL